MKSGGDRGSSEEEGQSDVDPRNVEAKEVLVLDSSMFIREIGLMSGKGSALKHYLYCRGMQLVVPEAAAEEYERNLAKEAKRRIGQVQKELRWLAQFCGGVEGWRAPADNVIDDRAKALGAAGGFGAILLPESDDIRTRARLRDQIEQPPSHRKASMGDCRIWEQCLDLLSRHDVVFVADDRDFRGHRERENLHPLLRAEAEKAAGGGSLTFYPDMVSLLSELKSEIPPIQKDAIFEFVYDASRDTIRELKANSGCWPTSTGTIKQARLTTEELQFIEVRLEVEDIWQSDDGARTLPFHLSGSCHYHLGDGRLADLKAEVVRLSTTEPGGSVRSVKGSHVAVSAHFFAGTPPIQPERGTLE